MWSGGVQSKESGFDRFLSENLIWQIVNEFCVKILKAYCKRDYFRWGKISQKWWQDISRGGNIHDTTPVSFIKAYRFYFHVGVTFAKKTKAWKTRKLPPRENFHVYSIMWNILNLPIIKGLSDFLGWCIYHGTQKLLVSKSVFPRMHAVPAKAKHTTTGRLKDRQKDPRTKRFQSGNLLCWWHKILPAIWIYIWIIFTGIKFLIFNQKRHSPWKPG